MKDNRRNKSNKSGLLVAGTALTLIAGSVQADLLQSLSDEASAGTQVNVYLDVESTDNAQKTDQNKQHDIEQTLGVNLNYGKTTRAVDLKVNYQLKNSTYSNDAFSDEVWLSGGANLVLSTTPERYSWFVGHQQSESQINFTASDTPDNRDQRSTFTTGPDVNLKLTPVDFISAKVRRVATRFDKTDSNQSDRDTVNLNLQHRFNDQHSLSLVGSYTDVEFTKQTSKNYQQSTLGLSFQGNIRYAAYSIGVGNSRNKRESGSDINDQYANLKLDFYMDNGSWGLSYDQSVTDSSVGLSLTDNYNSFNATSIDELAALDIGDGNINQTDIVNRTRTELYFIRKLAASRFGLTATLSQDEQDYADTPQDTRVFSAEVGLSYILSRQLSANLSQNYKRTDYLDQPQVVEDQQSRTMLTVKQQVNDQLSLGYRLSFERRENVVSSAREYDEFSTAININYRFH